MTIGYFVSVVDQCVNPPATIKSIESIYFQERHPNLSNLTVLISVTSGAIVLKTDPEVSDYISVEVIRGASDQDKIESLISFQTFYNDTHLSLIGETPTSLLDCPTVQIIVTVPSFYSQESMNNTWLLSVETGQVHVEEFIGSKSTMLIHVTTGAVHIDNLFVQDLEIITNAGAVIWKNINDGNDVWREAKILTNSGYIEISDLYLSGAMTVGTNTGVVSLKTLNSAKLVVDCLWGVILITDVDAPTVVVNSDSAHICLMNSWDYTIVELSTQTGTFDFDGLQNDIYTMQITEQTTQLQFEDSYPEDVYYSYYYITTVSGTVTMGDSQ